MTSGRHDLTNYYAPTGSTERIGGDCHRGPDCDSGPPRPTRHSKAVPLQARALHASTVEDDLFRPARSVSLRPRCPGASADHHQFSTWDDRLAGRWDRRSPIRTCRSLVHDNHHDRGDLLDRHLGIEDDDCSLFYRNFSAASTTGVRARSRRRRPALRRGPRYVEALDEAGNRRLWRERRRCLVYWATRRSHLRPVAAEPGGVDAADGDGAADATAGRCRSRSRRRPRRSATSSPT